MLIRLICPIRTRKINKIDLSLHNANLRLCDNTTQGRKRLYFAGHMEVHLVLSGMAKQTIFEFSAPAQELIGSGSIFILDL